MPAFDLDALTQTLQKAYNHITHAGAFNEGQPNQIDGSDLPPEVLRRVQQLAKVRDALDNLDGPDAVAQKQHLQDAINFLYNPRTRQAAMSSWAQLHGDENNPWSATGGTLPGAVSIVNPMTTDPDHNYYGGRRK